MNVVKRINLSHILVWKPKGKTPIERPSRKWDGRLWTEFILLNIRSGEGLLRTR
jgi:hypothetical protein